MIVGIDFDNTIALYDDLFIRCGIARGLISHRFTGGKSEVRAYLRSLPEGEELWITLQGVVYGQHMAEAGVARGVKVFIARCHKERVPVFIISHKTQYPVIGKRIDLRTSAMTWLQEKGFFVNGMGLTPKCVFFSSTRGEKIKKIIEVGCTHFIDDLPEVFLEPSFPVGIHKILYKTTSETPYRDIEFLPSWSHIEDHLL